MITKQEATAKATNAEDLEFALWERTIDDALAKHSGRTTVDIRISCRVRDRLMAAYRRAGWTVTYHDDQCDGASLEFT